MNWIRLLRYKRYQKTFSKNFIKRSKQIKGYEYYLKYNDKHTYKTSFIHVALYDVLDNHGFKKLINGIYRMKRKKKLFKVETSYINRKINNINYINIDSSIRGWARIGDIYFKKHKWLSKITITYTSNNSSEIIVEYNFLFKKVISTSLQKHLFVIDELKSAKKELYFHSYANKKLIKKAQYKQLYECDNLFFSDILQSYICKYFYTKLGAKNKLPIEFCFSVQKFNKFRKELLKEQSLFSYYIHDNNTDLICVDSYFNDRYTLYHFCGHPKLPSPILLSFFSDMSMEMYFQAFYKIEKYELEEHMRKYLNSRKRFVSVKDIKWLIRKLSYINEQKNEIEKIESNKYRYEISSPDQWYRYYNEKKQKETFIMFPEYLCEFQKLYNNNLDYLKSISSTQNDKLVLIIAVATLIATIIGIGVTVAFALIGGGKL